MEKKDLVQSVPELIGSIIEITQAAHKPYIGLRGVVIDETKNMFVIEKEIERKLIRIPKKDIKFKFITDEGKSREVNGTSLLHRSEDRLKRMR
jgi:RNase P/RNase MRP subunit p29